MTEKGMSEPFQPNCSEGMSRPVTESDSLGGFTPEKIWVGPTEWTLVDGHVHMSCVDHPGKNYPWCPGCFTFMTTKRELAE